MAGSDTPRRILIGTTNPSKFQSLSRRFFQFSGVACVSPSDLALQMEIPETGATMAENAQLKARAFHRRTGLAVLSADSGLFFRELPMDDPRQPGPYIRRVGGRVLTDEEMNRLVDDLFAVSTPNYTPDGKTVLAVLKEDDLEKMFK